MNSDKIIIVGGGSAGWMTASTLIKAFPNKNITVIESPEIPTIGVGESTIAPFRQWTKYIGIDDKDFVPHTDASIKLSIKFTDFYKKGESFHYPFGEPNLDNTQVHLNDWWFRKLLKPETPNSEYAECYSPQMALVNENKCHHNTELLNFKTDSAFHFDATMFGQWLKDNYCLPRGVKHIKEEIKTIEQDENGIKSLNNKHTADLFIDCTGFKSLLLGETLREPFISFNDMLPNNSAWATKIPYENKREQLKPYTNCTAYNNGWIWNIPLWSRIGTGYVYSDKFVDDETALKEFKDYLGREDLEFKKIKMRVGIHKRLWVDNVVAIGLSAGFIEPLESNGLYTVHEFLTHLVRNMGREKISQFDKDNFTYACRQDFECFAEFVALHYALSHRDDTEYWKANLNKTWSNSLIDRVPLLVSGIDKAVVERAFHFQHSVQGGLHYIAAGMNWSPTDMISLIKNTDIEPLDKFLKQSSNVLALKKQEWKDKTKNVPVLYDYLKKEYYKR